MHKNSTLLTTIVLLIEIIAGVLAIVAFLSFFLTISAPKLHSFDSTIISWIYSFRSETMTEFMKVITFFGGEIFVTGGIVLLLLFLFKKHKISSFNFAFILLFGTVINLILKSIYQRPRPDNLPLMYESTYSFPSGHAMNSFIFYACIYYFIFRNTRSTGIRVFSGILLGFLVLLIGVSRIYLGVHYPSDVIAGFAAGVLWFLLVVLVEKTARKLHFLRK